MTQMWFVFSHRIDFLLHFLFRMYGSSEWISLETIFVVIIGLTD